MMVLIDKRKFGQTDATLLVEELAEIYTTPTPKCWHIAKKSKLYLIDWMSFTIDGVQYLYPEPKHKSYSSMTYYKLWYKRKHS